MHKKDEFDPVAYIENAFLDTPQKDSGRLNITDAKAVVPTLGEYVKLEPTGIVHVPDERPARIRFKKTAMSAPRPRRSRERVDQEIDPEIQRIWETLPRALDFLTEYHDDAVTSNYYGKGFKESRKELIQRILDPELSLEEVARLLGVCPATVRRYTNRGWMEHHRTKGGQRRFRLGDVVRFVEKHGRFPEE